VQTGIGAARNLPTHSRGLHDRIKPSKVIAMHYGMNPQAYGTLPMFLQEMGNMADRVVPLKPGEKTEF
jgi:hypothetical protein